MATRARIAAICQEGQARPSVEANRERMLELAEQALVEKPDLVCLPEAFVTFGVASERGPAAEPLDGPTVTAFARVAKRAGCYIICPLNCRHDGKLYNTAVVIGRDGKIAGHYDKACPVTTSPDYSDLEQGTQPGSPPQAIDLDFGRIGVQICFDAGFPENWQALGDQGARLVFWPSAYDGGFPLRVYAWLHHYWVVSATRTGKSRIVDPCGEVLMETALDRPFIVRDINLDYVVAHWDFNFRVADAIRKAYPGRVDVRDWDKGCAHFIAESTDPTVTAERLQEEFKFESTAQYHARHRAAYKRMRAGKAPLPQRARHGNRPQYG